MKTILYATDCSKTTKTALNHAYEFSLAMNAELHILHVYDLFPIVTSAVRSRSSLEKNYHNERLALLKRYCMKYTNENVANKFRYHLEKSDTKSKAILDTAIKIDADLVIIGHKDDNLFNLILPDITK